tara:strand:+ start:2148 stop:2630 length:483 start_codon:yes stop_codon:yes gene_type:complete
MADPTWLAEAKKHIGTKEVPGRQHNSKILGWLRSLKAWWSEDETPWCGTFVAHCLQTVGLPVAPNWFRAKDWATYGSNLRSTHVAPGAILVFAREGGGHVGFYTGEDNTFFYVLGGNQSNAVNVMKLAKARCIAIRWPAGQPVEGAPVRMAGGKVSTNEA